MLNALSGGMIWQPVSTSTSTSVRHKYSFKIDTEGPTPQRIRLQASGHRSTRRMPPKTPSTLGILS
ncbi:hypothetical protein QBC40DRAFT_259466, partial [Triangularia verruculosa]